jgi:hypothetical protein
MKGAVLCLALLAGVPSLGGTPTGNDVSERD